MDGVKRVQARELRLLFVIGRAGQLDFLRRVVGFRIAERIDANDRQRAIVLLVLVEHRLFLDLAALVTGLHGAQHAATFGNALKLLQYRFFDQVGQFVDDE